MLDAASVALALVTGVGIGSFYFVGLWWTVRRAGSFRRPGSSMLASVVLRMCVALGGFYLVGGKSWQLMLLCLLGFLMGRAVVSWRLRPWKRDEVGEVPYAP